MEQRAFFKILLVSNCEQASFHWEKGGNKIDLNIYCITNAC
jgi:hypothetical protein